MPVVPAVSYPGVYVQEVESDVHTIVPVDTATTAFVGRALRGAVNKPVVINSFGDFQRIFGGLWSESSLGYAVNQFFLNGGSKAVIVRLCHADPKGEKNRALIEAKPKEDWTIPEELKILRFIAKFPGDWGNKLTVEISGPDPEVSTALADKYKVDDPKKLFNLKVADLDSGVTEYFANLTKEAGQRQVDKVLINDSQLIALDDGSSGSNGHSSSGEVQPSDGGALDVNDFLGKEPKTGIYALEDADIFNLLYIPPIQAAGDIPREVVDAAATYCEKRRAILLIDPPKDWVTKDDAKTKKSTGVTLSNNAAIYFPNIKIHNPLRDNQLEPFGPCAAVAGIIARTDATRGVWKAPAGLEATLKGVAGLSILLTDAENGELNPLGINCLRQMPAAGYVVWGARTLVGDDRLASQWKYLPVRRTALFIEESLYRGTQWAVFEPNDEPLWSQLRLNIGVFMHGLFRQGAFQGQSPQEAYFVRCDKTTTEQADIDRGIVNVIVGFAPLKPAEFVILYIQQIAGQLTT